MRQSESDFFDSVFTTFPSRFGPNRLDAHAVLSGRLGKVTTSYLDRALQSVIPVGSPSKLSRLRTGAYVAHLGGSFPDIFLLLRA
jgi:hypothetical protein